MRLKVVAIRDRAVAAFMAPNYIASVGSAVRSFGDLVNNPAEGNAVYRHPEDYDLYELGEFDDELGRHFDLESPRQLAIGKDLAVRS